MALGPTPSYGRRRDSADLEQEAAGSNPAIPTGDGHFSNVFAPLVMPVWLAAHGASCRSGWLGGCARWLPRLCRHKAPARLSNSGSDHCSRHQATTARRVLCERHVAVSTLCETEPSEC